MYMEYFITFVLALIVAFSATPIAKKIALRIGAVDMPKDERRVHSRPIALFGGAAIIAGFVVSIAYNLIGASDTFAPNHELLGLMAGLAIIAGMGIADDKKHLKAPVKLAFQLAAALVVILLSDTRIKVLTNPFSSEGHFTLNIYVSYALTLLWIVGVTNAINLIDGLDGLAAGVASISALSLFFVSLMDTGMPHDPYISIITAALAGAALGFLPFNFNPAKIFMGETGAAFLGFTLGVVSIQGMLKSYAAISIAVPFLVLGLPLFDTGLAILRRLAKGRPVMAGDRNHIHHRLLDMGLSHKQSVIVMYIASAMFGLCAVVMANKGIFSAIILLISISVFLIGGARYMNEINGKSGGNYENPGGNAAPGPGSCYYMETKEAADGKGLEKGKDNEDTVQHEKA